MLRRCAALTLFVVFLCACGRSARLYNLSTGEVTRVNYSGRGKGKLSATLASGENIHGEFVSLPGGNTSWGAIYASVYSPTTFAQGSAQSVSGNMQSKYRGSAIATGDKGTIIQCEYIVSEWTAAGSGACEDNHGVKYKLMF